MREGVLYMKGEIKPKFFTTQLSVCLQTKYLCEKAHLIQPMGNDGDNRVMLKIEEGSSPLSEFAVVKFGMQLRNRKLFPTDVITNPVASELTSCHKRCITGKDIMEFKTVYNNRYCYFNNCFSCIFFFSIYSIFPWEKF